MNEPHDEDTQAQQRAKQTNEDDDTHRCNLPPRVIVIFSNELLWNFVRFNSTQNESPKINKKKKI